MAQFDLFTLIRWIVIYLAPVVQRVDNAIHRINHYPADSVVCFANIYPVDSVIPLLNNRVPCVVLKKDIITDLKTVSNIFLVPIIDLF